MKLLEQVGLTEKADELGENLSYGQQKLVAIVRLLAMGGEALLLDEPVAGVDPGLIDSILETIRQLAQEGKTVVVIEHNMNAVLDIADRAYFMDDGQCLADGSPETVLNDPDVRAAYMGLEEMSGPSNETASVI
jgi:ABC-type branched-subunit amino acid transport system ATPase component